MPKLSRAPHAGRAPKRHAAGRRLPRHRACRWAGRMMPARQKPTALPGACFQARPAAPGPFWQPDLRHSRRSTPEPSRASPLLRLPVSKTGYPLLPAKAGPCRRTSAVFSNRALAMIFPPSEFTMARPPPPPPDQLVPRPSPLDATSTSVPAITSPTSPKAVT